MQGGDKVSGGITVKEFKYVPGVNDAEYIKKLEELREIDKGIINAAVAKIKRLSAQPMLSESDRTICKMYLNDRDKFKTCNEYKMLMRLIDNSVQPKHGEWEYHSNPTIGINPEVAYCSCCGFRVDTTDDIDFDEYNFCPRCGADMRTKETDCDYERAVEQLEHDMLYEPTFNPDDGSM